MLDFHDPAMMLKPQGKLADYLDITDFVPGHVVERERKDVPGTDGLLVIETGPRKPQLKNITVHQWGIANVRIMYELLCTNKLKIGAIPCYLTYSQNFINSPLAISGSLCYSGTESIVNFKPPCNFRGELT